MAQLEATSVLNGFKFTAGAYNKAATIGLTHRDSSKSYTDIDFSILFSGYRYYVYENSAKKWTSGHRGWSPHNDVFEVRVNNVGNVEYVRNRVVFYTSSRTPDYPLLVDTSFATVGAELTNVRWLSVKERGQVMFRQQHGMRERSR